MVEPWPTAAEAARPEALELCLVLVWFADEPWRVGHVARLGPGPVAWLGRYHEKFEDEPPVLFFEQRPGLELAAADLMTTKVSRRQLRFSEIGRTGARVENVGRRQLFVNGKPAREARVAPGDTLMLEHTAVFLVDARPPKLAPLGHYPAPSAAPPHESERGREQGEQDKQAEPAFAFGASDALGMVGESPAAWRLRYELAAAARAEAHVLLLGETGAGKELAAARCTRCRRGRVGPWWRATRRPFPEACSMRSSSAAPRTTPAPACPSAWGWWARRTADT